MKFSLDRVFFKRSPERTDRQKNIYICKIKKQADDLLTDVLISKGILNLLKLLFLSYKELFSVKVCIFGFIFYLHMFKRQAG